ncbi:MAG: T9SS C-terminal target domain-containing protein [Balneolaceae bacterium]|nr:MAG: T9SS C-terminal target domain-containing protein [Balneolaceae bacterium]
MRVLKFSYVQNLPVIIISGYKKRDYFLWILNSCKFTVTCLCFWIFPASAIAQFSSEILYYENDKLTYISDRDGNRIPDFSHAGYHGGGVPLPNAPVRITISPVPGDNTQHIQDAINSMRNFPADQNGIRGAVKLNPGVYNINGNLYLNRSGVILRGTGGGSDPAQNSIIRVSRDVQGTVLLIGDERVVWHRQAGERVNIVTDFVPVGSRTFEVEDASSFNVGDNVIIRHISTRAWLSAVNGGDTAGAPPWEPGFLDIFFNRNITNIEENKISIDAPVYNQLDRRLSQSVMYKPDRRYIVSEVGVENLRIEIQTNGPMADNHAAHGIIFRGVENGWANNVTVLHFRFTGIGTNTSRNITIKNSRALDPHSPLTGERRYNFNTQHFSNNILFSNITSTNGRRDFVSNGTSVASGIVFHNSRSVGAINSSEGHQKWSQALLYDNITFDDAQHYFVLALYNRGNFGSSHGWSSAHSVAWNVNANGRYIFIQKPPTAQNYGIGNQGRVSGSGIFDHPDGYIEGTNLIPNPESLYLAQLEQRLNFGVPPDAPARLTASNQVKNQVILTWIHSAIGEMEYLIERSEDGKNFHEIGTAAKSDSLFVDSDLIDKTYHYRMRANDGKNKSAYSNPVRVTPSFNEDAISDFRLQLPLNGANFVLKGEPDEFINFLWHKAESNFDLTYTWYLETLDGDFTNPILKKESIQKPPLSLTLLEINQLLNDHGIEEGDTLRVKWTVKTGSNILEKWSETTHQVNIIRHYEPEKLNNPENHAKLDQNFPNPFNPATTIRYHLSEPSYVRLDIYDLVGTRVATLVDEPKERGSYDVTFNADNLASGIYLYRIFTDQYVQTRKMVLIK